MGLQLSEFLGRSRRPPPCPPGPRPLPDTSSWGSQTVSSPWGKRDDSSPSASEWGGKSTSTWGSGTVSSWDSAKPASPCPPSPMTPIPTWGPKAHLWAEALTNSKPTWGSGPKARSWAETLADSKPSTDPNWTPSDDLEPDPKRRALSVLEHDLCFVSCAFSVSASGFDGSQQQNLAGPALSRQRTTT